MYSYYAPLLGRSRAGGGGLGHLENWMKEVVGPFCLERGISVRKRVPLGMGGGGCAFLLVEAIPSSGSHYMVWDIAPIEIIEQSIFWSSTPYHWAQ